MLQPRNSSETVAQTANAEDFVTNSFRLPMDVYEALRQKAFDLRISQAQIVVDALRAALNV